MERRKFKRKEEPSFFSEAMVRRTKQGMQSGVDKLYSDVNNFLIPKLREAEYDGQLVRGADILKRWKEKEHEKWADIHPRLLIDKEGWWLEIWPQWNKRHKMIVKPFIIESTKSHHLKNRPRLNLPQPFLKELKNFHSNIWIKSIWTKCFVLDLHFLIVTKTGMFWMGAFHQIPDGSGMVSKPPLECGWELTYRNDPKNPDRFACKPRYQEGAFRGCRKHLKDAIMTEIYYWTKNNTYASK